MLEIHGFELCDPPPPFGAPITDYIGGYRYCGHSQYDRYIDHAPKTTVFDPSLLIWLCNFRKTDSPDSYNRMCLKNVRNKRGD